MYKRFAFYLGSLLITFTTEPLILSVFSFLYVTIGQDIELPSQLLTNDKLLGQNLGHSMWTPDAVPILSQVKSFIEAASGDFDSARRTQATFLHASPRWIKYEIFDRNTVKEGITNVIEDEDNIFPMNFRFHF